jgi:hypothetical protein
MCCFVAGLMLVEIVWLVLGVMWLVYNYHDCPVEGAKEAILGKEQCYSFNVRMYSLFGHKTGELYIQGFTGGTVNILGGGSMDYSE